MKKIEVIILSLIVFICFNTLTNSYAKIINEKFNILQPESFSSLSIAVDDAKDLENTLTQLNNIVEKNGASLSHRYTKENDLELSFLYFYAGTTPDSIKQSFQLPKKIDFYTGNQYYTTQTLTKDRNAVFVDSFKRKNHMINSVGNYTATYTHIMPLNMMNNYYQEIKEYTIQHGRFNHFVLEFDLSSNNTIPLTESINEIKNELKLVEVNHNSSANVHGVFQSINFNLLGILVLTMTSLVLLRYQVHSKKLGIMGLLGRPLNEQIKALFPSTLIVFPLIPPVIYTLYFTFLYYGNTRIMIQLLFILFILMIDVMIALLIAITLGILLIKSTSIIATIKGKNTISWFTNVNYMLIILTTIFLLPNLVIKTQELVDELQTLHKLNTIFTQTMNNPISITYSADFASDFEFYSLDTRQNNKLYQLLETNGAIYYEQDYLLSLDEHNDSEFNALDFIFINNTIVVNKHYITRFHPELNQYIKPGRFTTFIDKRYQPQYEDSQYNTCSDSLLCDLIWIDNFKPTNLSFDKDSYNLDVAILVISHEINENAKAHNVVPQSVFPMKGNMFFQQEILPEVYQLLENQNISEEPRVLTVDKYRSASLNNLKFSLIDMGFELSMFLLLITALSLQYIKSFFSDNAKEIAIYNLLGKPKRTIYWPILVKIILKFIFISSLLLSSIKNYFIDQGSLEHTYSVKILISFMLLGLVYELSLVMMYDYHVNKVVIDDLKEGN
ncbi:hypothetical protein ERUR111494_09150 [Erysipelothrix urinaevulpis]|uniref:hypothetical protein n=1 Tax=Erysipelothrix urinaevulpis TaxID=2683717 RepID=UPI00135922BE|nr:hypothetical protein [Erysipelothrix urinaevulpis]